ncbi:MAG: Trk system potassium transporter TrkA [Parachlamydia sp.]|nr:Trk system potassium transporter TrkA [Parachlamydia sp.]
MNIVIVGAGEIGRYLASLLSKEQHNVVLVDKNAKILEEASFSMDVATRQGSGTDWQLLDELLEKSPDLILALTNNDEANLVCCTLAKQLGYPRAVARVRDNRYFNRARLDFARLFNIDSFVGPELLVAHDILKYMISPGSLSVEHFAHGAVQMRTFVVPAKWRKGHIPLSQLQLPAGMVIGLLARLSPDPEQEMMTIFPHGEDCILPGDEITCIGETEVVARAHHFFGLPERAVHSVAIVGGGRTAVSLARLLEQRNVHVRIIEKDYEVCCRLAEQLPKCVILHHDAADYEFLKGEKIGEAEALVTCTGNDEVNVMVGFLGKQAGCQDIVVMLSNRRYFPFVSQLGLHYTVSPRLSAANHILSQVVSGRVTSLVSLYENQAEIMEINVSMTSPVAGISLSALGPLLPKDMLICMIQNRGRILIAHGARVISPGDTVIVITHPRHVQDLKKMF